MSKTNQTPLRIAIECRIPDPQQGLGSTIRSLVSALSSLKVEDQHYTFLVTDMMAEWVKPFLQTGPSRLLIAPHSSPSLRDRLRQNPLLRSLARRMRQGPPAVPASDGLLESGNFDLVHFPTQVAYRTALPSIYEPWDLQHLHHAEYFTNWDITLRESRYRAFCAQATFISVPTEWTKTDLIMRYGLAPEKVVVTRWGSIFDSVKLPSASDIESTVKRFKLPPQFFLYPAALWPHKNHSLLLRALHLLKSQRGLAIPLYLTGSRAAGDETLMSEARSLGVESQIIHLGFVSAQELQVLYMRCAAMVFPSRFEGYGLPILEAFQLEAPVLCSNASVLPETADEGAAYFSPDDPHGLAAVMWRVLKEPDFVEKLRHAGKQVLARSSMEHTAMSFRELYSRVAAHGPRQRQ